MPKPELKVDIFPTPTLVLGVESINVTEMAFVQEDLTLAFLGTSDQILAKGLLADCRAIGKQDLNLVGSTKCAHKRAQFVSIAGRSCANVRFVRRFVHRAD